MTTPRRRISAALSGLALGAMMLATAGLAAPEGDLDVQPAFADTCIGYCRHPTNAAKVFRWGREKWRQEFEVGRLKHWQSDHPGLVVQDNGMLKITVYSDTGSIAVWPDDQSAKYGRWEARVRAWEKQTDGTKYRFTWELVPVDGDHCGGSGITMATYKPGNKRVRGWVRTLPDQQFTYSKARDLRSRAWHTYAVEVTPNHISWFVDTKVMRTERRPAALSGVTFRPQFRIEGVPGEQMNESWMQMDWARYYTLKRPNAKPIGTRQMRQATYAGAC